MLEAPRFGTNVVNNLQPSMQWKKGQSGNPGGKRKFQLMRKAFENCLSVSECEKIARSIIAKAQNGDISAAEFTRDTIGEKPVHEIDVHDERSGGLTERFTEILAGSAERANPGRESGTGRVN